MKVPNSSIVVGTGSAINCAKRALASARGSTPRAVSPATNARATRLDTAKAIKAVILTHSETSTGVINDLETIAKHVKAHGTALTIADCVTSLGACSVPMDAWGIDVIGSGSQKGYMMPPGLAFVAMSDRAWAAAERSDLPKFYLDLAKYRKSAKADSNPFTPAINLYFALEAALEIQATRIAGSSTQLSRGLMIGVFTAGRCWPNQSRSSFMNTSELSNRQSTPICCPVDFAVSSPAFHPSQTATFTSDTRKASA